MIALKLGLSARRDGAVTPFRPLLLKLVLWGLVLAWTAWIASQWLRDASATQAPTAAVAPRAAIDLTAAVATAAAAPVFGEAAQRDAPDTARAALVDIKLKGTFAGGGGPAAAIVNVGDEDELVLAGRQVRPGVVLESIHPTHIVVGDGGASRRVELEAIRSEQPRSKPTTRRNGTASAAPAEAPSPPVDAESATPLAPPMPQSRGEPDPRTCGQRLA